LRRGESPRAFVRERVRHQLGDAQQFGVTAVREDVADEVRGVPTGFVAITKSNLRAKQGALDKSTC
jgi:hypothetical protein